MNDPVAIWREALKDAQHPRNQAVWLLFSEGADPKSAARLLADHQAEVVPWLLEIVDTPSLYEEGSFGSGLAPANAVGVLGKWLVLEVVPCLLHILETEDQETLVYDHTVTALEDMGTGALEPLLAFAEACNEDNLRVTLASILSQIGKGDERVYRWVLEVFNQQKHDHAVEFIAENLLAADAARAIPYLEACLQKRKYAQRTRAILQRRIEEARRGEL